VLNALNLPAHPIVWVVHTYSFSNCHRRHYGFRLWLCLLITRLLARSTRRPVTSTRCPTASMHRSAPPDRPGPPPPVLAPPQAVSNYLLGPPLLGSMLPRAASAPQGATVADPPHVSRLDLAGCLATMEVYFLT
jgi:hypothetical protein